MGLQENKVCVALVGDAGCGKTALAVKFTLNLFMDYYHPTESVQDFTGHVDTRNGDCKLTVLDTSSTKRPLSYACSNVVKSRWLPELNTNCPAVPFIIAGCKRDEMCDGPDGCVCKEGTCCDLGEEQLTALLSRTGASAYIDCSALAGENVDTVFGVAAESVKPKQKKGAKRLVASIKKMLSRV